MQAWVIGCPMDVETMHRGVLARLGGCAVGEETAIYPAVDLNTASYEGLMRYLRGDNLTAKHTVYLHNNYRLYCNDNEVSLVHYRLADTTDCSSLPTCG